MEASEDSYIKPEMLKSLGSSIMSNSFSKNLREVFKSAFITNCTLDDASVTEEELQTLDDLDSSEIIDNLKSLLSTLLTFKSNCKNDSTGELATRCDQLEKMLQKQEAEVRNHIKLEHQLKLHIDSVQQKLMDTEKNFSEAQATIKEMEGRGLESMQSKLKKIETKFQAELSKVVAEYKEDAQNELKKNERIKKLEEMYEKKEKAYVKLHQDYLRVKGKLEETLQRCEKSKRQKSSSKTRSVSDDKFQLRRSSYIEDFNKVQNLGAGLVKDSMKPKSKLDVKFHFKKSLSPKGKQIEPVPPPIELKQSLIGKNPQFSSRKHTRSTSDCGRPISAKKFKIKNKL